MKAILFDVTRCTGCERCVNACIESKGFDPIRAEHDRYTIKDGLSANRVSSIVEVSSDHFARKACMHCLEPSCVSACLVGGLTKTAKGPVVYDSSKCIGCRYCMLACPFTIPRYEWDEPIPFVQKCDMCYDRIKDGLKPACVEACPNDVMLFGEREELLAHAHQLVKENPHQYIDHVWGELEFDGTSVLYVTDVELSKLDFPFADTPSIPSQTEFLIKATPFYGTGVLGVLTGINWIIKRRMKLAEEKSKNEKEECPGNHETGV